MSAPNIRLQIGIDGRSTVEVDGKDVSRSVMDLTLRARPRGIPTLEIECLGTGEVAANGRVQFYAMADGCLTYGDTLRDALRNLLERLEAEASE